MTKQSNKNISVIIPLYNKARHIKRAIDSVLAQSHQDFEIIVVNDGSTDGSEKVVQKFSDPRLRLLHQTNSGAPVARNRGAREAQYDYVAFLDADDEWLPDFLLTITDLIKKYPQAAMWGTSYNYVKNGISYQSTAEVKFIEKDGDDGLVNFFIRNGLPFNCSQTACRKETLLSVGGFPIGLKFNQITMTWYKIALRHPVAFTEKRLSIHHRDVDNPTWIDDVWGVGIKPAFNILSEYIREKKGQENVNPEIIKEFMISHWVNFLHNLFANNRPLFKQFYSDFRSIRGYQGKALLIKLLSLIPVNYTTLWKLQRLLRRKSTQLPPIKSYY